MMVYGAAGLLEVRGDGAAAGAVPAGAGPAGAVPAGAVPDDLVSGTGADAKFREAGGAYEAGRFGEAAGIYEQLLAEGYDDPRIHYNLGNAQFKSGKLAQAILEYERALARDPEDADARENLAYANLLTVDKVGTPEDGPMARLEREVRRRLGPDRAVLLAALLALVAGLLALPLWFKPAARSRRVLVAGVAAAGVLCLTTAGIAFFELTHVGSGRTAIVMSPSVDGRSAPASDGTVLFTVHEGLKVEVRSERDGWLQVGLPNSLVGWIPTSAAEPI